MTVKPISPKKIGHKIPDVIIEAVNEAIEQKWNGIDATIYQKDLLKAVHIKDAKLTSTRIFDDHLFDFEPVFRKAGWKVTYDSPGYNESYEAFFVFSKK